MPPPLGPMPTSALMRTLDERFVRASPLHMFEVARDVERWPDRLAHYRYVRVPEPGIVEMSANRPFGPVNWPTWWTSYMEVQDRPGAGAPAIRFRHIHGITTRMEVEWAFAAVDGGTHVTVLHLWNGPSWPMIGEVAARGVIGPVFVHGIASRTLEGLARVAEGSQTSDDRFHTER